MGRPPRISDAQRVELAQISGGRAGPPHRQGARSALQQQRIPSFGSNRRYCASLAQAPVKGIGSASDTGISILIPPAVSESHYVQTPLCQIPVLHTAAIISARILSVSAGQQLIRPVTDCSSGLGTPEPKLSTCLDLARFWKIADIFVNQIKR